MTISASARSTQAPVSAAETWSASIGPAAANTVTRMPTPTAPPRWWKTLTRPPATPASWASTPAMPAVVRLLNPSPWPRPKMTIGTAMPSR